MAGVGGIIGGHGSCSSTSSLFQKNLTRKKKNQEMNKRASCICSPVSSSDHYKTLKIHPGASESQIKKAFRHLALQYHPDVCRGSDCGIQFHQINEAYEALMNRLQEDKETENERNMYGGDDQMRGMHDADWDMWEEWMGWEGAGIRDYSSHINPYT